MARSFIKKTRSLSPITYEEVDAEIFHEDGKVFLEKQDEEGNTYKSLVEQDADFYRLMTKDEVSSQVPSHAIDLYVSERCNLSCPLCYEDVGGKKGLSLTEIEEVLRDVKGKVIVLMGREPTCREELPEIIKIASKQNRTNLLTNGIKLADHDYLLTLKRAGLDNITFSFNGFDDEIYRKLNGKPLLDVKLRALENIKKAGIPTVLSATFAKGVNDDQVRRMCDYCFENQSFIYELRIRSAMPVGRHIEQVEPFCMSEMVDLVASSLGIQREDILREYDFWQQVVQEAKRFPVPTVIRRFVRTRLCSLNFHVKRKEGTYSCLGKHVDADAVKRARFKEPYVAYSMLKAYGPQYILKSLSVLFKLPYSGRGNDTMMIVLRIWPSVHNVDMAEMKKCATEYYKGGKCLPFCYANIIEGKATTSEGDR
jgi:hypothetical protein